jgi:hypothetical protein
MDMRRRRNNDDDGERILEDGESIRVPFFMCDGRPVAFNALDHQPGFRVGDAEVRDARSSARAAWIRQMADAWNQSPPSRDAAARPDLDPDDDPGARMRGHLQTESNEESQRRRDAAWGAYKDQLANAWMMGRTNPQAATAVERQRRQWTAEPMRGA